MGSDMVVALARATADGQTLFGHGGRRTVAAPALVLEPGRAFAPGQVARVTRVELPQVRQTWSVLGCRSSREWGYRQGVNEKGVAAGVTSIYTRLRADRPGLTGPDLVRVVLERAGSALQAVDVLTDLIGRHEQEGPGAGEDSAFVVADGREAHVLEACGGHWALQQVGAVRAVSAVSHLRRDWNRISPGLADLAIAKGWWPEDGSKLDFAGSVGREGPGHAAALRRWGLATVALEQHSGQITGALLRRVLGGENAGPALIAELGAGEAGLAWYSLGEGGPYFPLSLAAPLPAAFADEAGAGCRLWRDWARWREDGRLWAGMGRLQERFDATARELLAELAELRRRGAADEARALAGSFMQHNVERLEELVAGLGGAGAEAKGKGGRAAELAEVPGANF